MIAFNCPQCDHEFRLRDDAAGKAVNCRNCHAVVRVPMRTPQAQDEPSGVLSEAPDVELDFRQHPPHAADHQRLDVHSETTGASNALTFLNLTLCGVLLGCCVAFVANARRIASERNAQQETLAKNAERSSEPRREQLVSASTPTNSSPTAIDHEKHPNDHAGKPVTEHTKIDNEQAKREIIAEQDRIKANNRQRTINTRTTEDIRYQNHLREMDRLGLDPNMIKESEFRALDRILQEKGL